MEKELINNSQSNIYPFHMPGHKRRGSDIGAELDPYAIDITEIDNFDNLHHAEGIIKEAQAEAAALYGAKRAYFLINGSTCGILAAISAATKRGDKVLVARNCHKAVYHALYLRQLHPVFTYPEITRTGLQGQITEAQNSAVIAETETTEPEETEQKNEQQIAAEKLQQETETQMEVPKEPETETPQESVVSDTENAENAEQTQQEPFTLVVNRGDVCRTMCENLAANGVIDDSEGLRKYLSEVGYASFISAGTYQIPYHASYEEITNILKAGPMEQQQQ